MTTAGKFRKLGNAIKRYRGRLDAKTGKWIQGRDRNALSDVYRWLDTLGIDRQCIETIDGFKTFPEYRAWMKAQQEERARLHQERLYR